MNFKKFIKRFQLNRHRRQLQIVYCLLLIVSCTLFSSCSQIETFEKNTSIPNYQWNSNFKTEGNFLVTDTAATYKVYIVLRHTDAYKYNNIWLNVGIAEPGDSLHFRKVDMQLGTDAAGWAGSGMNDIWEIRQLLMIKRFTKTGTYKFAISQIMRDNPLPAVMSAGMRLEKQ
jgi:gliding motility-associated lipoprotein GldH